MRPPCQFGGHSAAPGSCGVVAVVAAVVAAVVTAVVRARLADHSLEQLDCVLLGDEVGDP